MKNFSGYFETLCLSLLLLASSSEDEDLEDSEDDGENNAQGDEAFVSTALSTGGSGEDDVRVVEINWAGNSVVAGSL